MAGELRAGEQKRRRQRDHDGEQHDAQADQERVEDGADVPGIGNRRKGPIQVKAAIRDDRPGKYREQGTENQNGQSARSSASGQFLFQSDCFMVPPLISGKAR